MMRGKLFAWAGYSALGVLLTGHGVAGPVRSAIPVVTLQSFFLGNLQGSGTSQDSEHGARTVTFSGVGTAIPGGLQLAYDAVFSDGEHQHRVWTFMDEGQGRYTGHRADVIGDAQVTQTDNDIEMTYKARVPTKGGTTDLNFDEHFTLTPAGTVVDRLTAHYLFFNVASGELTIRNAANRSGSR